MVFALTVAAGAKVAAVRWVRILIKVLLLLPTVIFTIFSIIVFIMLVSIIFAILNSLKLFQSIKVVVILY